MEAFFKKLLTYSYNITGSYDDAKDLVQDTIEKYIAVDKSKIENENNFLIKSVINHSINFKNRNKRKARFGVWLPEPVATEGSDTLLIKKHTANYSLLVLMEKLNAKERAVFILKEAFDYSHDDIADVLDISSENSRQLLVRAKKSLKQNSFDRKTASQDGLQKYIHAIVEGDIEKLEELLVSDIMLCADGGNKVKVVKDVEMGKAAAAQLLFYVYNTYQAGKKIVITQVNHQPAICFYHHETLFNCLVFHFTDSGKIDRIYSIVDPIKLKAIK